MFKPIKNTNFHPMLVDQEIDRINNAPYYLLGFNIFRFNPEKVPTKTLDEKITAQYQQIFKARQAIKKLEAKKEAKIRKSYYKHIVRWAKRYDPNFTYDELTQACYEDS